MKQRYEAVVIGSSAGGVEALSRILPLLPPGYPLGVIVVQHVGPGSNKSLADCLGRRCRLPVVQAEEKEKVRAGVVHLAPSNYHLMVEKDKTFSLSTEGPVNYSRPSIDVLFETAADAYGPSLVGVILTGANEDGGRGLQAVKSNGGLAIVQDPLTAEASYMPKTAIRLCEIDYVLSLKEIGEKLKEVGALANVRSRA